MTTQTIDSLKEEIADCYIKQFQKELWWIKSITILPIKPSMKDILIWKKELPEKFIEIEDFKFWKNVIQFLSPKLANQIFDFLKAKRQEIVNRQTVWDLTLLKNEILWIGNLNDNPVDDSEWWDNISWWWQNNSEWWDNVPWLWQNDSEENKESNGINPVVAWVVTSAVWAYGTYELKNLAEWMDIENVIRNLDDTQIKKTVESAIDIMEKQKKALTSRLTPHQVETVENHIKQLQEWIKDVEKNWGVSDLLKDWYAVREKLPWTLLKNGFNENILKLIDESADQLHWKPITEIKKILKISDSDESLDLLLKSISGTKDAKQIKQMTKVIRWWNRLSKFAKTFAWAMRLDVAFAWLDVRVYLESEKEAELISEINKVRGDNKHNQALFQLWVWLWSVVAEWLVILWICAGWWSYWWPIWTLVWLAVWAAAWGISEAGDALYYDVKDFYVQNDEDFLRQSRWKIKQGILQLVHNYKKGDTSVNEKFTTWVETHNVRLDFLCPPYWLLFDETKEADLKNWKNTKELTFESACRSMIFLEEIEDGADGLKDNSYLWDYVNSGLSKQDFLKDKDEEYKKYFNEYLEKMVNRINKRMEYVEKEFDKPDIIDAIYAGEWVKCLTQIFTESKGYANISDDNKRDDSKTYSENKLFYKEDMFKDFPPEKVEKLDSIRENDSNLFLDIITTTSLEKFVWEEETDENYRENVNLVETYKKYMNAFENFEDKHYLYIDDEYKNGLFIYNVLKADFNIDKVKYPTTDTENLLARTWLWIERRWLTEISDNILQNILYKLAKQLNGYTWKNDMYELMRFYGEGEDDVHWIYYSDKRKINEDWAIDARLDNNIPKIIDGEKIDEYVDRFMKNNFYKPIFDYNTGEITGYTLKSSIDTPTESIDPQLTAELINVIEKIVREELTNHSIQNQEKVKEEIKTVIKQNSNGEYIELPYYLILKAKESWLWDLQRQFFKRNQNNSSEGGVVEICYMNKEYNTTSIFDNCEKSYISSVREKFTQDELAYINRVDNVCENLRKIRNVEWWWIRQSTRHEDDLDLPIEIERIISDKIIERENFKDTVLLYDANTCNTSDVITKYIEYAEYFECLYKWILFSEAGFSWSNDIDSFQYFQSAMWLWSLNLFTNEWELNIDVLKSSWWKWFDFIVNDDKFIIFYKSLLEKLQFKAGSKMYESLEYRWKQWDESQKELARRVSYDIITTTFEKCLLQTDSQGNISMISKGSIKWKRSSLKDDIEREVKNHISKMELTGDVDTSKITPLMHEREIKKLTQWEKETTDLTPIINALINERLPQVNWSDNRLQLQYDAENSTINSWWEKVKISIEKKETILWWNKFYIKINWLDIEFNRLKEWIRTANLINWLKYNMRNEPIWKRVPTRIHPDANLGEYKRETGSLVRDVNNSYDDIEILTEDILDEWYPTIKNSAEFLKYVNKLLEAISSNNWWFSGYDDGREEWEEESPIVY